MTWLCAEQTPNLRQHTLNPEYMNVLVQMKPIVDSSHCYSSLTWRKQEGLGVGPWRRNLQRHCSPPSERASSSRAAPKRHLSGEDDVKGVPVIICDYRGGIRHGEQGSPLHQRVPSCGCPSQHRRQRVTTKSQSAPPRRNAWSGLPGRRTSPAAITCDKSLLEIVKHSRAAITGSTGWYELWPED